MPLSPPPSLEMSHQEILQLLVKVQQLPGKSGSLAENVAKKLQTHIEKEEALVLPLLGLLAELAKGKSSLKSGKRASRLYSKFKQEYPGMVRGHEAIRKSLNQLKKTGAEEGHLTAVRFAEALEQHSQEEEEVLYPAALLAGKLAAVRSKRTT